ncbi:MAG: hypothetical protein GY822_19670 [Deltaproteobacteria bacterium]|nr:hypothetical protein [Deltaproteobacteria bacterium]
MQDLTKPGGNGSEEKAERKLTGAMQYGSPLVPFFDDIEQDDLEHVGGKGLSLGTVTRHGLPVPAGFCVTTESYKRFTDVVPDFVECRDALENVAAEDTDSIRQGAAEMRDRINATTFPSAVVAAVTSMFGNVSAEDDVKGRAFAVRSSATLEDLPEASFAEQHDSYLEVRGVEEILQKLRECFASLFTDRGVAYRRRQELREVDAQMAVVVQAMAASEVAGVLFTADPISGSRDVCIIDASYGLGEAVVSGVVNPDGYRVNKSDGVLVSHHVGDKLVAIVPENSGGVQTVEVAQADRERRALDDKELAQIVELGRNVEELSGQPQDVEWGIENGGVMLLQSRPITSLYPLPQSMREFDPSSEPSYDDMLVFLSALGISRRIQRCGAR